MVMCNLTNIPTKIYGVGIRGKMEFGDRGKGGGLQAVEALALQSVGG